MSNESVELIRTAYIMVDEHKDWRRRWEIKTGKCSECTGEGETIASCGVDGTTYRTCFKCKGTGAANP